MTVGAGPAAAPKRRGARKARKTIHLQLGSDQEASNQRGPYCTANLPANRKVVRRSNCGANLPGGAAWRIGLVVCVWARLTSHGRIGAHGRGSRNDRSGRT